MEWGGVEWSRVESSGRRESGVERVRVKWREPSVVCNEELGKQANIHQMRDQMHDKLHLWYAVCSK